MSPLFGWETRTRTLNNWTRTSCVANYTISQWSERQDLNLRPPAPKAGALPSCATFGFVSSIRVVVLSGYRRDYFQNVIINCSLLLEQNWILCSLNHVTSKVLR